MSLDLPEREPQPNYVTRGQARTPQQIEETRRETEKWNGIIAQGLPRLTSEEIHAGANVERMRRMGALVAKARSLDPNHYAYRHMYKEIHAQIDATMNEQEQMEVLV